MASKRYSESALYEFASQILLEEKEWKDFDFLDEDDKAKVLAILQRGKAALAKKKEPLQKGSSRGKSIRESLLPKEEIRVISKAAKPKKKIADLTRKLGFKVFPLMRLVKESELLRRKILEVLTRRLDSRELAFLFSELEEQDIEKFLEVVSPRLADEIRYEIENPVEEEIDFNLNALLAKFSVDVSLFLVESEEVSADLKLFTSEYLDSLKLELGKYCKTLSEKGGLIKKLSSFSSSDWQKLAGLTPRPDMALLSEVLEEEVMKNLCRYLPPRQVDDLKELIAFNEKEKKEKVTFYVKVLEAVKHWATIIDKVEEMK